MSIKVWIGVLVGVVIGKSMSVMMVVLIDVLVLTCLREMRLSLQWPPMVPPYGTDRV